MSQLPLQLFTYLCNMMLSILIPEYNQDCSKLVHQLNKQCKEAMVKYEIIILDDCSKKIDIKEFSEKINQESGCKFLQNKTNLGRSKTRNKLINFAQGDYLLFIDSDAQVYTDQYIENYLEALEPNTVICGGITHTNEHTKENVLRWKYEKTREKKFVASRRNKNPYANLRTFNFIIPLKIALQHPFDEDITLYGYEDTLLGCELEKDQINILHIDNPLINADIEKNEIFLYKTEESLHTLSQLQHKLNNHSALLQFANKIDKLALTPIVKIAFNILQRALRKNLLGANPSMILFQFYKLGYYLTRTI